MAASQFEEWMEDYEAKLREGVHKRSGLTDVMSDKTRPDDGKRGKIKVSRHFHSGLQSTCVFLADEPMMKIAR
jgi:hypothetical protein